MGGGAEIREGLEGFQREAGGVDADESGGLFLDGGAEAD